MATIKSWSRRVPSEEEEDNLRYPVMYLVRHQQTISKNSRWTTEEKCFKLQQAKRYVLDRRSTASLLAKEG